MKSILKFLFKLLVVASCIMILLIGGLEINKYLTDYSKEAEQKRELYEIRLKLIEEVDTNYRILKSIAPKWNRFYAELSLKRDRDTVQHKEIEPKDFLIVHQQLFHFNHEIDKIESHKWETYKYKISDLGKYQDTEDLMQWRQEKSHMITKTYILQEQLMYDLEELNKASHDILAFSNSKIYTDNTNIQYNFEYKKFYYYLNKVDKSIYNLLKHQYADNLNHLIRTSSELRNRYRNILLEKEYYKLETQKENAVDTISIALQKCMAQKKNNGINMNNFKYYTKQKDDQLLVLLKKQDSTHKISKQSRTELVDNVNTCLKDLKLQDVAAYYISIQLDDYDYIIKTPDIEIIEKTKNNETYTFQLQYFYRNQVIEEFFVDNIWYPKE